MRSFKSRAAISVASVLLSGSVNAGLFDDLIEGVAKSVLQQAVGGQTQPAQPVQAVQPPPQIMQQNGCYYNLPSLPPGAPPYYVDADKNGCVDQNELVNYLRVVEAFKVNVPNNAPAQVGAPVAVAKATTTQLAVNVGYAEDLTDYANTVVVPTVYVKFLVQGSVFAVKQGGYRVGQNANTVRASAKYRVAGMDKTLAREISRQVHDDFVNKLRAAGYTVLTYDDIKDRDYVRAAEREAGDAHWGLPVESPRDSSDVYLVAAPSDAQQFKSGFAGGVFSEFISSGKPKFHDATLIIPTYTIVSPQVWGETGATYSTISAGIKTAVGMTLRTASARWMGKPRVRMGGGNHPGVVTKHEVVNITEQAGYLVAADTTSAAANSLSKDLSFLTGAGSIRTDSSEYIFTLDRNAYIAGVLKGTGDFNAQVAMTAAEVRK